MTFALVVLWRGSGGLGRSGEREWEHVRDSEGLVLSLWKWKGGNMGISDVTEAIKESL